MRARLAAVSPLHPSAYTQIMCGCLKLLIYCTRDEYSLHAEADCKKLVWSGGISFVLAAVASEDIQLREAGCVLLLQVTRHTSVQSAVIRAGGLIPLLNILYTGSAKAQELSCAILLQLVQRADNCDAVLVSDAAADFVRFLEGKVSDSNRRRVLRILELLAAHEAAVGCV